MPQDSLRFTQIVTGVWSGDRGNMNHSLYGLTADGDVYKFYTSENCWRKLPIRVGPDVGYDQAQRQPAWPAGGSGSGGRKEPF